jgi:hypothetical protein
MLSLIFSLYIKASILFYMLNFRFSFSVVLFIPFVCSFMFSFLSLSYSSYLSYFQTFQPLLSPSWSRSRAKELHSFILLETEKHGRKSETILSKNAAHPPPCLSKSPSERIFLTFSLNLLNRKPYYLRTVILCSRD